jgi:hypothetical protein
LLYYFLNNLICLKSRNLEWIKMMKNCGIPR